MESRYLIPYNMLQNDSHIKIPSHCRFCAKESKFEILLDLSQNEEALTDYLKMMEFLKIDFLDFSNMHLPKTSCEACYRSLKSAYNFIGMVKQSQFEINRLYLEYNPIDIKIELETVIKHEPTEEELVTKPIFAAETTFVNCMPPNNIKQGVEPSESPELTHEDTSDSELDSVAIDTQTYGGLSVFQDLKSTINLQEHNLAPETESNIESSSSSEELESAVKDLPPLYCGFSVFESDVQDDRKETDSWMSYPWSCKHCNLEFDTMSEVRDHSKALHDMCYGFDCVDCDEQFNMFNSFVEHVRLHRDVLRYYCQYCNDKFETRLDCEKHALSHWEGTQKICDRCGQICPDAKTLESHKRSYKQFTLPRNYYRKRPKQVAPAFQYNGIPVFQQAEVRSWKEYEWICQDCGIRASDADSLRAHIRSFHNKCFAMKCADCLKVVRNYFMFVPHVTGHRPYLKHYCQYCNLQFDDLTDLSNHVNEHLTGDQRPCDGCGQIFENNTQLVQHLKQYDPPRRKGNITTEELTCDVCSTLFKTLGRLRSHRRTHNENRKRDNVCDTCGKGFYNPSMLAAHALIHNTVKAEVCQICKKEFTTKQQLRSHVKTHLEAKLFTCDECGKNYRTKNRLKCHIVSHSDVKQFKCMVCDKQFNYKTNLKTHMNIHTGFRPYSCEQCEKTFTNWANCNKHMIRKHGVTIAKTKLTPQGRVEINKVTGKAKKLASDTKAKEWMSQMIKPARRGKKTAKEN